MIKKNENANVKKRISRGNYSRRKNDLKYNIRVFLLILIITIVAIFVIIRSAKMVKFLGTSVKDMIDKWANGEISYVQVLEEGEMF